MLQHVLWDWNGTLLDDVTCSMTAFNRMLERRSLDVIDLETYRDVFDFPVKSCYEKIGFNLVAEDWDVLTEEFHANYRELATGASLRNGIEKVLSTLHSKGVSMSVLSACEASILQAMIEEQRVGHYFAHISGLDNLHAASKLETGTALLAKLDIPSDDIVMIGDTQHDYTVAKELGVGCILLEGGYQNASRLPSELVVPSPQLLMKRLQPMLR